MKNKIPKVIIFDLDGTLTESKADLDNEMSVLLGQLLKETKVAVISGGSFSQFQKQFLGNLKLARKDLEGLFLVPTNGSAMYRFQNGDWREIYAEVLSQAERQKIFSAFAEAIKETGFVSEKVLYGEQFEDRNTQITFSGLGQLAPVALKKAWDPDRRKRIPLKEYLDKHIPEFEVRINSSSSIDITRKGIDKAYGIRKISEYLKISINDMVFIGDALFPGGNDYAAKSTGIECFEVKNPNDTKILIKQFLKRF